MTVLSNNIPTYMDPAKAVEIRVKDLISCMTLQEKLAQLGSAWAFELLEDGAFSPKRAKNNLAHGIGQITRVAWGTEHNPSALAELSNEIQRYLVEQTRLGIPAIIHEECCSGYMMRDAPVFPQSIGAASTWDPDLIEAMASVIKTQMLAVGARQGLAPVLDLTRDPRWGRVEETFGEDPHLAAQMAIAYVRGLQGKDWKDGVLATAKHFAAHGMSEGGRNWSPPHLPQRELREVTLLPFEAAVKEAKLASIMSAYHELDGIPCSSSYGLLTEILRNEWGFKGFVVSDYFAIDQLREYHQVASSKSEAAVIALTAGIDTELPGSDCFGTPLQNAVETGLIDESMIDLSVSRILRMKFLLGLFEDPYVDTGRAVTVFDTPEQRNLTLQMARKSIVLLKNEHNLLPLRKDISSLAVIGPNAKTVRNLVGDYAYVALTEVIKESEEQGGNVFDMPVPNLHHFADSYVPMRSILESISEKVSSSTKVVYAEGCSVTGNSKEGFEDAVRAAREADIAVLVVGGKSGVVDGCTSGESRDRADINLPGVQEALVRAIVETGTPTVAILVNGRPYAVPWLVELVPAILEVWLPGVEGAKAVADVLFGNYNPGGKLPITFPRSVGQIPVYYAHKPTGGRSHWSGDYIDLSSKPLFPFGFGLSYTTFEIDNLRLTPKLVEGKGQVTISVDITNTGNRAGDEVVQLYLQVRNVSVTRPVKELKGFKRVSLKPDEKRTLTFALPISLLGFYNREMEFVVEPSTIKVMIGVSSEDIRQEDEFTITGDIVDVSSIKCFSSKVEVT